MLAPTLLAVALAASPVPATELVDLLDFDQGTLLVSSPASYGAGVRDWSAFRATDGDPAKGWCSAQGKPLGAEFIYELSRDAELKAFRATSVGVQEGGYHGISVRALELWTADAAGPFTEAGVFEVPRGEGKEFPLPAGKLVRRVKIVVRSNWGNPTYTELMELDLLGRWLAAPPAFEASGDYWSKAYSGFRMKQTGSHLEACYDYFNGTFSGELEGRVAKGTWREQNDNGTNPHGGKATFVIAADRSSVRGVYFNAAGALAGTWDLDAPAAKAVVRCQPRGSSMADRLKREGRLALYGIHFDSGSDVPRADSQPTLEQLAEVLAGDPGLKLQVEGHTDSTNTDAFNLDLSDRRARAVARWLGDHGVAAGRLTPVGYGRTRPVAPNETSQGRALNRRVEVALPGK